MRLLVCLFLSCISTFCFSQSIETLRETGAPLIIITTTDSVMPQADVALPPNSNWPKTITNNNYVTGSMIMLANSDTLYASGPYVKDLSGMKIKRRGNSTGLYLDQHPYKLKLTKKKDLLFRNNPADDHKEWLLLSLYTWNTMMTEKESNIINMTGTTISQCLEKEWTPEYIFVHLILNGQYQGMYYLMEAVARGENRINISKEGFIIEDDTFFWNENIYTHTNQQPDNTAWTFKYPDDKDISSNEIDFINTTITTFEQALHRQEDISTLIDIESWAKWILIHDILGTDDALGCNKFYSIYNQTDNTIIKTGPIWDYDSSFRTKIGWSYQHHYGYYQKLFQRTDFVNAYLRLWNNIKPSLYHNYISRMEKLRQRFEYIFDESVKQHQKVYPNEGRKFSSQYDEINSLVAQRINILTQQIDNLTNSIYDIPQSQQPTSIYNLNGQRVRKPTPGLYIHNGRKFIVK